jgi:hypothetical protein
MKEYLGEVIDISDPQKQGRIKVRVRGVYDTLDDSLIPFSLPRFLRHNEHSLPSVGSEVSVIFLNNDSHLPTWYVGGHYDNDYELSDEDYESAEILVHKDLSKYGSEGTLSVRFEDSVGLTISLEKENGASILIDSDGTIKIKSGDRTLHVLNDMISLGQEDSSSEPAVLGDKNESLLNELNEQDNTIVEFLTNFLTQLASVSTPNPYTSPIGALATSSVVDLQTQFLPSYSSVQSNIPQTKSEKTTLD